MTALAGEPTRLGREFTMLGSMQHRLLSISSLNDYAESITAIGRSFPRSSWKISSFTYFTVAAHAKRLANACDPNIVTSNLSGIVAEQGITVRVNIIRLENEPDWSLEVENENGTSTVWDDIFATDDAAVPLSVGRLIKKACAFSSIRLSYLPSGVSAGRWCSGG
jgi:hypothetical protein